MVQKNQFPPSACLKKIGSPHPNTPKSLVPPSNLPTPQAIINERSLSARLGLTGCNVQIL